LLQAGGASIPYLIGAEVPNAAVREKTQSLGAAWNVVWAFVTNFVIPYMMADIHFGVGWVFGSVSVVALLWTFFFLPETKVRHSTDENWKSNADDLSNRGELWRNWMLSLLSRIIRSAGLMCTIPTMSAET
jgi:Na+/melibiose symporter-like transporter